MRISDWSSDVCSSDLASRAYSMAEMTKDGVQFYVPTADEIAAWSEACGHQRPEWDSWKKELGGSLGTFDKLLEAANTPSPSSVPDVRSAERRGGKEGVITGKSRWWPNPTKKKK